MLGGYGIRFELNSSGRLHKPCTASTRPLNSRDQLHFPRNFKGCGLIQHLPTMIIMALLLSNHNNIPKKLVPRLLIFEVYLYIYT